MAELDPRAAGARRLRDKVCVVTEAGQGIGRATAKYDHAWPSRSPVFALARSCLFRLLTTTQTWIQQIPQGIAEHIKAEHCGAEGDPRPDG